MLLESDVRDVSPIGRDYSWAQALPENDGEARG